MLPRLGFQESIKMAWYCIPYSIPILYSKSLDKATFDSGKKLCFQVKWYQFIQNQVKSALVKEFLFHSMRLVRNGNPYKSRASEISVK